MYEKELQNLGLSEKESKIYLTSLELGAETAQNIAKKSGINRATTYVQIDSLKKKGLMSEFEKGKKTFYVAESPQRLSGLLNVFEKELDLRRAEAGRILPALLDMFLGMGERPKVRFFEGNEGIESIRQDFLKTKDDVIQGFINLDALMASAIGDPDLNAKRRIEHKITSNLLYSRADGPLSNFSDPQKMRVAKYIPTNKFSIAADITMYDNKVAIITYKENHIGVIIESKEIADTLRAIFYAIWNNA